jgi:hypothetical protein
LYANGNPQGRSYALAGLRELNLKRFNELLASAKTSTDKVEIMHGCIGSDESLTEIARQIDLGDFSIWVHASVADHQGER